MPGRDCFVAGRDAGTGEGGGKVLVAPLGIFGVLCNQREMVRMRAEIERHVGTIAPSERGVIANYLRSSPIVIALMEQTFDVLENKFSAPGGSAIHSDGSFYWRGDAANYVFHYGVALPPDFLLVGRDRSWVPPSLSRTEVLTIDDYLAANIRRGMVPKDG